MAAICCVFLLSSCFFLSAAEKELLGQYRGKEQIPAELYDAYTNLVAAMEQGDVSQISQCCVSNKISITREERVAGDRELGEDINIPFVQDGFDKQIAMIRKDSDNEYIIRTSSSVFWFTRSQDGRWILSRYLDRPID